MIKKVFPKIFILIFIFGFSYLYGGEYLSFYKENKNLEQSRILFNEKINNFSLDNIKELENASFYYSPKNGVLEKIIEKIESAKEKIYIEVYMLTETRVKEALKKAKAKGIDIKIILEKNPYMTVNINNKTYDYLIKLGIDAVWSNPKNYSLNHTKIILIDEEIIISTGNLTHSTFKYNRDLYIFTSDKNIVKNLSEMFLSDFSGKKIFTYNDNLIISPNGTRKKFETLFTSAKKDIKLYFQYFQDDDLEDILIKKVKDGVQISIITDKKYYNSNLDKIKKFESLGINIKALDKYTMHSKAILIDEKYLYIGSINFSKYSIDKNREVGIILKNEKIIQDFLKLFSTDSK